MTSEGITKFKKQLGKHISIYLKEMTVSTVSPDGETVHITAMVEGYVVDVDSEYLYLGDKKSKFNKFISHSVIGVVEINDTEPKEIMLIPSGTNIGDECH